MIQKIRNSRAFKGLCMLLVLNILVEIIAPMQAMALTGGPAQPEFSSFTPVGTSDMVDLSSGDMNYNIPLMDVGGYPLNMAYSSGIGMDDEASWVGLGWNLSVGQINRNVRGLPDDFNGDEMTYENNMKPNVTVGAAFKFTPAIFGIPAKDVTNDHLGNVTYGVSANYNNYNGFTMKPSIGVQLELGKYASVGFNVESGSDGLSVSPSVSIHQQKERKSKLNKNLGINLGVSLNSRQGLTSTSLAMTSKGVYKNESGKSVKTSGSLGSSIGFTDMIYTPTKRTAMVTGSFTVNAALGVEFFGGEGQGQITAFGTVQKLAPSEKLKTMQAYGYANTEKGGSKAILDFNREKDGAVSVNTTNLPLTNYTYDIYSIQGQGVSGMYRPYRNQVGFVYDARVEDGSFSGNLGLEFGVGNAVHNGIDIEATDISSSSGDWVYSNNIRSKFIETTAAENAIEYEKVHYKNVGDLSADREFSIFQSKLGGYQPIRIPFIGSKFYRYTESKYHAKTGTFEQHVPVDAPVKRNKRQLRNQAIHNVTVGELRSKIGYGPIAREEAGYSLPIGAKDHHIGEVQVVRNDGARYIYGLPAYNHVKKEATFAVGSQGNCNTGIVNYTTGKDNSADNHVNDRYFERVTTPSYVHTHLLTSVLSTDYADRGAAGPSPEDLGSYTKFSYEKKHPVYKWRVPLGRGEATFNEGLKSDLSDNQGNYVYGEKEAYYLKKIETKTHIAVFTYSERADAKGVLDENGGIDQTQNSYKLDNIKLYSIAEYNGGAGTPIKEVHFVYNYSLCPGVLNNSTGGGKLTLTNLYFTYRDSKMGKYTGYKFNYNNTNPAYNVKGYDTWGNYKPNTGTCQNSGDLTAPEFPFVEQKQADQDARAAAWSLSSIDLPSGGKINIKYESDDYAYVQDKEAMRMFKVVGAGSTDEVAVLPNGQTDVLYNFNTVDDHKKYLYVEVPETTISSSQSEIKQKYFAGTNNKIYFRFLMNMTVAGSDGNINLDQAKYDYVTGYAELDNVTSKVFKVQQKYYLSIPLKKVNREGGIGAAIKVNPIAKASWNFGRKYLNKHVFSNQANGDSEDIMAIVTDLVSPTILNNLKEIFTGPNATLENKGIGRRFILNKSWIRLKEPTGKKLGGGCRVKKIEMNDIWTTMNPGTSGYQDMNYGQQYDYTLTEKLSNGTKVTKSSGVATYEPVGNKENPFVQPVFSTTEHLLAPDEENFIEMPFGESFYPNPQVTYSRVSVSNLTAGVNEGKQVKRLHKTGYVVTEFFTSKDYPVIVDQTILQAEEDDRKVLDNLLSMNVRKHMTASQGYVIHLNDMNGKQKSQRVYAEGQEDFISGVDYHYDNFAANPVLNPGELLDQNKGRLNNTVRVVYPDGTVKMESIGVEYDVVNDFRENRTNTYIQGMNTNLATFFVAIFPALVPIPLPDISKSEDQFRSVSTTKVINTFGILKETVAYDAGAEVYTRNIAWDALTGEVLATETIDEFNDKYYTFNYPAHWFYSGMGQAAHNLGLKGKLNPLGGNLYGIQGLGGYAVSGYLTLGDEIIYGTTNKKAWVTAIQGNSFKLMDAAGALITDASGDFKIVRSGRRNLQSAGIMNVTLMRDPFKTASGANVGNLGTSFLVGNNWDTWKIINAGAVDYSDDWKVTCECDVVAEGGVYNPYVVNEKGVWRTKSSRTYLTGRNSQAKVTPRRDGYFTSFSPFYKLNSNQTWYKDMTNWTFVSEVSRYSPYGFELENKDALNRYSGAQYGYNNTFPMAVGANTRYTELGYDGFEDYGFTGCKTNQHFSFDNPSILTNGVSVSSEHSHTGRSSIKVSKGKKATLVKRISCLN